MNSRRNKKIQGFGVTLIALFLFSVFASVGTPVQVKNSRIKKASFLPLRVFGLHKRLRIWHCCGLPTMATTGQTIDVRARIQAMYPLQVAEKMGEGEYPLTVGVDLKVNGKLKGSKTKTLTWTYTGGSIASKNKEFTFTFSMPREEADVKVIAQSTLAVGVDGTKQFNYKDTVTKTIKNAGKLPKGTVTSYNIPKLTPGETADVSMTVKNTGEKSGNFVGVLGFRKDKGGPVKHKKIQLDVGESKRLRFDLPVPKICNKKPRNIPAEILYGVIPLDVPEEVRPSEKEMGDFVPITIESQSEAKIVSMDIPKNVPVYSQVKPSLTVKNVGDRGCTIAAFVTNSNLPYETWSASYSSKKKVLDTGKTMTLRTQYPMPRSTHLLKVAAGHGKTRKKGFGVSDEKKSKTVKSKKTGLVYYFNVLKFHFSKLWPSSEPVITYER